MSDLRERVDLASQRLGGAVMWCTDDTFGAADNLLRPDAPASREGAMDGWATRRKRTPGHDAALVRLGVPGVIRGVVVDTTSSRGDAPAHCAVWACDAPLDARVEDVLADEARWVEVLPKRALHGDAQNVFEVDCPWAFTWVRLDVFPDGGVARLRVHGDVVPEWRRIGRARGEVDLAALEHGGVSMAASGGAPDARNNLLAPGRAREKSEAWLTPRRRGSGPDWNLLRLGARGAVRRVEIDTSHLRGDHPDACHLEAIDAPGATREALTAEGAAWRELLPRARLQAHTRHRFEDELRDLGPVTHLRLVVHPDGGVSRLRAWGALDDDARRALGLRRLDTLTPHRAEEELRGCNASSAWLRAMLAARPFGDVAALFEASERAWAATGEDDWREAFRSHPRIGESKAAAGQSATERRWSSQEQRGAATASDDVRRELAEVNRAYEARFGHIYLVCATGRSAEELLAIARARMNNAPEDELRIAAAELGKITRIRLEKLLEP